MGYLIFVELYSSPATGIGPEDLEFTGRLLHDVKI